MSTLNLALFGPFEISLKDQSSVRFRTARAQALLAYLTTEFALGTLHLGREALMELLWPGMPPDSARTNLRQNLYYLRQSIPPALPSDGGKAVPFLLSDRQMVAVNADYPLHFDVQRFVRLLAGPAEEWPKAVALYRGEFLADFYLPDANPFEEWATVQREVFRRQILNALEGLTDLSISKGLLNEGERQSRQQLAIDPLRETAYRQLMKILFWTGRRAEALTLYRECARIFEAELDAPPSEATRELANAIREGTLAGWPETPELSKDARLEPGYGSQEATSTSEKSVESAPQAEQARAVRHNLPAAITPFVGREQELATLSKLITDPEVHIVTIIGPGGIGKTRLALEAAGQLLHSSSSFTDGIFFVSLAPIETAGEIEATLATALGFSFQHAVQAARNEREQILEYLARKKMLLVMDNFEHVLNGGTLLAEIGNHSAGVKVLVTSRERLQLRGEHVFPIHGLEMPQAGGSAELDTANYAAARLFYNAAKRTTPSFELLEGDAEQILRICRLVEGMPLGLELAASWTGLLPLSEIAADIEHNMQFLSTEYHDAPSRHHSMRATLDLSWKRLTPEQKLAFQNLSIFRGGFTRSSALEVAGAHLSLVVALANKSWLTYDRKNDRYHIHELLRQYGMDKLKSDTALEQAVHDRYASYFCRFLKEREQYWFRDKQQEAAAEVRKEIENIQSAWRLVAGRADVRLLAQGMNSLGRFFSREMTRTAGREAFRAAAAGLSALLPLQEIDDPQSLILWSQILAWQADFTNEPTQKQQLFTRSQDILDRATAAGQDTRAEQAFIFLVQARAMGKRDYKSSIRLGNLAQELFRELGDQAGEAETLKELGLCYRRLGKAKQSYDALRENLDIRQHLADRFGAAEAMHWLAIAALTQLKIKEAEQLDRQALALFRQLGSRYHQANALMGLSFSAMNAGEYGSARELIDQALNLEQDSGLSINLWVRFASAVCDRHLGRYSEAEAETSSFLDIARQRGLVEEIGSGLELLGAIAVGQGDLERAKGYFQEGMAIHKKTMDVLQFRALTKLGYIARVQNDDSLARKCLIEVLCATRDYEYTELIIHWLPLAALLAADDGRPERSVELFSLAQNIGFINNSRWWEDIARRELDRVRASLPPKLAASAEARGQELDLHEMVDELLLELARSESP